MSLVQDQNLVSIRELETQVHFIMIKKKVEDFNFWSILRKRMRI